MKNLKKREKYLIIIFSLMGVAYVYYKLFLMPVLDNIQASKEKIDKYNGEIIQLKVLGITNNSLKRQLSKAEVNYKNSLIELPQWEKSSEIIYNLKPIADKNNIILNNISISPGILYTPSNENNNNNNNLQANDIVRKFLLYGIIEDDSSNSNKENDASNESVINKNSSLVGFTNFYSTNINLNVSTDNYSDIMNFVDSLENDKRIAEVTNLSIQNSFVPKKSNNDTATDSTINNIENAIQEPGNTDGTSNTIDNNSDTTNTIDNTNGDTSVTDNTGGVSDTTKKILETPKITANISINYFYTMNSFAKPKYDFNIGTYGKNDLFN